MPVLFSAFSIGKDQSVALFCQNAPSAPAGFSLQTEDLGLMTEYDCKPVHRPLTSVPINNNGISVHRDQHGGWDGVMTFDRQGPTGDLLEQMSQDAYFGGAGSLLWTITHTKYHPIAVNGVINSITWVYPNSVLYQDEDGSYRSEDKVIQRYTWHCGRRLPGGNSIPQTPVDTTITAAQLAAAQRIT